VFILSTNNETKVKDITKGLYIPSIEACWLYKFNQEIKNYEVNYEYLDKLLNGKLDYSFELVENKELLDGITIEEQDNKLYTLDIVNVKYTKKYKSKEAVKTTKELKDWTYKEGFVFNSKKFRNWKRSGGKARVGQNLFCLESIKDKIIDWARIGLKFEGKQDVAGIRAYESLPLSSIIGCIELDPEGILVIDDYESKFPWVMSKTWLEKKKLKTEIVEVIEKNSIWDGEGLLSKKIFVQNEILQGHGVGLLRNRFMKCAGFSCDIELFFRRYCERNGLDYDTYEIEDKYHNKIKVKDILLITTPSAIKLAKYNDEVMKISGYEKYGEGAWLKYWKDNCGYKFGICKVDKPSHNCIKDKNDNVITFRNVLSYQMVNTIPFEKEELKSLLKPNLEYIDRLKNDLEFFLKEVKQYTETNDFNNSEPCDDEHEDDNTLTIGLNIDTTGAFTKLANINPKFANTQVFKDYRRNFINAYVNELRKGKIMVEGADYAIACGNPIELLKATVGEFDGTSDLKDNELYCSRFKDGEKIIGFRNPSINVGNIGIQVNKEVQDIKDYMECTPTIVFLNSIKYPILSTYQGEDFDIDCNLLINNKIITDACDRIDKTKTPIPYNAIENTGSNKKELTDENMSNVDFIISRNYIGSTINLSQELNSLYNHLSYNKLVSEEELREIYELTSRCSSISQTEIDKAKKQFEDLNVQMELDKMKKGLKLVDDKSIKEINNQIKIRKDELANVKKQVNEYRKNKRKPILSEIRTIKKELEIKEDDELRNKLSQLEKEVSDINCEREREIQFVKKKIINKLIELKACDNRRIKPYFFKFVGDNKAKKQRKATNKKHRRELDKPIILEYCKDNNIDIKSVDKKNKILNKLLRINDDIQKEWEDRIYDKAMDTPMNWLELELDAIKNKEKAETIQVIKLVKKNTNRQNKELVAQVIEDIKKLDNKIKGYKLNDELNSKEKLVNIRKAKKETKSIIKSKKLTKADLYGVLVICLNTCKNNGKIDKKSGLENIGLEILFNTYGEGMLKMFY
jgi:hypothetical protein